MIPFTTCNLGTTQAATHLNSDAFGPLAHGVLNCALHGATEHYPALQLLSNVLSNQCSIQIRLANLFDVDVHGHTHLLAHFVAESVDVLTLDRTSTRLNSSH